MELVKYKECTDEERKPPKTIKERVQESMDMYRDRLYKIERPSTIIRNRYAKNILGDLYQLRPKLIHYFWSTYEPETEIAHDEFFRSVDDCICKLQNAMAMTARNYSILLDEINKTMETLTNKVLLDLHLTTQGKGEIIEDIINFRKETTEQVKSTITFSTEIKRVYLGIKTKTFRDFGMLETRTYINKIIESFEKALPSRIRRELRPKPK